jgi:hypothetical protein
MSFVKPNLGQNEPHSGSDFLLSYFDELIDQKDSNSHVLK